MLKRKYKSLHVRYLGTTHTFFWIEKTTRERCSVDKPSLLWIEIFNVTPADICVLTNKKKNPDYLFSISTRWIFFPTKWKFKRQVGRCCNAHEKYLCTIRSYGNSKWSLRKVSNRMMRPADTLIRVRTKYYVPDVGTPRKFAMTKAERNITSAVT